MKYHETEAFLKAETARMKAEIVRMKIEIARLEAEIARTPKTSRYDLKRQWYKLFAPDASREDIEKI